MTGRRGKVVFVGAGPGAADLVTLRGAARLGEADVVLADALVDPGFRRYAPQARWLDVGKRGFSSSAAQATIDVLLVRQARAGLAVVRLKGGDPSLFGRLEEELAALAAAGIESEIVPGVTAASAAAAATGKPLTRRGRGRSVALVTAMTADPGSSDAALGERRADSQVFYMAGRRLGVLARRLVAAGWPRETPVSVVSRAGCDDELASMHRLDTMAEAAVLHAGRPTVAIVGIAALPVEAMPAAEPSLDDAALEPTHART